jgi:hypothetical protein
MLGQGICTGSGTQPNKLAWSADMNPALEQSPISNAQVIAAAVFSHSGEFAPQAIDLRLPGRGFDVEFKRSYRSSRSGQIGTLGRGWACGLVRKIERQGDDGAATANSIHPPVSMQCSGRSTTNSSSACASDLSIGSLLRNPAAGW